MRVFAITTLIVAGSVGSAQEEITWRPVAATAATTRTLDSKVVVAGYTPGVNSFWHPVQAIDGTPAPQKPFWRPVATPGVRELLAAPQADAPPKTPPVMPLIDDDDREKLPPLVPPKMPRIGDDPPRPVPQITERPGAPVQPDAPSLWAPYPHPYSAPRPTVTVDVMSLAPGEIVPNPVPVLVSIPLLKLPAPLPAPRSNQVRAVTDQTSGSALALIGSRIGNIFLDRGPSGTMI